MDAYNAAAFGPSFLQIYSQSVVASANASPLARHHGLRQLKTIPENTAHIVGPFSIISRENNNKR